MSLPGVDVIVVSYNRRELLLRCCGSVLEIPGVDLIVIDNASTDGSSDAVHGKFPSANVIEAGSNLGFGRAVNRAAAAGQAPRVLLLNSDATVGAAALEALVGALDSDQRTAAVGPRLRNPAGQLELSSGRTMGLLNEAWFKLLGTLRAAGVPGVTAWLERGYGRPHTCSSLTAACLLLERAAFEEVGGMDERFFLYAEDVDLCRRLTAAGWRLRYEPSAEVCHVRGASTAIDAAVTERIYRSSQLAFYRKHASAVAVGTLRLYLTARYLLASLLRRGRGRADARALLRWSLRPD